MSEEEPRARIKAWCRDGRASDFEAFYRQQAPRLWRFLRARGLDADSAYDGVAESFARFVQAVCRDPAEPVALLYRIALNWRIDQQRRAAARPEDGSPAVDAAAAPDAAEHAAVRELVAALPPPEQNLVLLRYWLGFSFREIAAMTGTPEGTLRRRGSELLRDLARRWQGLI